MMSRSSRRLETIMRGMLDREVLGGAEVRSPVTGAAAADGRRAASQEQCARRRSIASDVSGCLAFNQSEADDIVHKIDDRMGAQFSHDARAVQNDIPIRPAGPPIPCSAMSGTRESHAPGGPAIGRSRRSPGAAACRVASYGPASHPCSLQIRARAGMTGMLRPFRAPCGAGTVAEPGCFLCGREEFHAAAAGDSMVER